MICLIESFFKLIYIFVFLIDNFFLFIDDERSVEKIKEMEEQLKANALLMKEYETSFQQKIIQSKAQEEEVFINYEKKNNLTQY